jgi:hypothetical protein
MGLFLAVPGALDLLAPPLEPSSRFRDSSPAQASLIAAPGELEGSSPDAVAKVQVGRGLYFERHVVAAVLLIQM